MIVGVARVRLRLPDNHSLKGKRRVIKGIMGQISARFNVSISEVADHDLWQAGEIGIATVGNDSRTINAALDKIMEFIERNVKAEVMSSSYEIISLGRE